MVLALTVFSISCTGKTRKPLFCRADWETADLSAPYPSEVTAVLVEEGQKVKKGEVLIALDTSDFARQRDSAKAALNALYHQIRRLRILIRHQEKNLAKVKNLTKIGGAPQQTLENLQVQLEALREELLAAESQMSSRKKKISIIEQQMMRGMVRAPENGIVLRVFTSKGERALPGQPLVRMGYPQSVEVYCYVSHDLMSKLKVGTKAKIFSTGETATLGTVSFISPEPEFTPRYYISDSERDVLHYMVKIKVQAQERVFNMGEFVQVHFLLQHGQK